MQTSSRRGGPADSAPRRIYLALVVAPLAVSLGCGLEPIDDDGEADAIPAEVQRALDESCATSSACHAAGASLVVLAAPESAAILTATSSSGGGPLVTLGDLDNSYLAQKILGGPNVIGGQMPPSPQSERDDLNAAIIVGWIAGVPFEDGGGDGDGDATGDGDGDALCFIDAPLPTTLTFADIWPILEARCTAGCHENAAFPPQMLDEAQAYATLIDMPAAMAMADYVVPGDPDASYLWHKLAGTQATVPMGGGGTMPSVGALCSTELQAVYKWILTGAAESPP